MYAGLAILFFFLVIYLQQVAGYTAFESGLATVPVTVVMFALSRRFGALADRYGPRLFMGAGPLIAAGGILLLLRSEWMRRTVADVLPGDARIRARALDHGCAAHRDRPCRRRRERCRHRVRRQQRGRARRRARRRLGRRRRRRGNACWRHVRGQRRVDPGLSPSRLHLRSARRSWRSRGRSRDRQPATGRRSAALSGWAARRSSGARGGSRACSRTQNRARSSAT